MKIVVIFDPELFSFHYENEQDNEYDRLMNLWTDAGYLQAYAKKNNISNVYTFVEHILRNAEEIQDFLDDLSEQKKPFKFYFQALSNEELRQKKLPLQKGKLPRNQLRLYAVKLDDNCFVITGGAIKMSHWMKDHPDTDQALDKLEAARNYLKKKGILDEDSFYELIQEDE